MNHVNQKHCRTHYEISFLIIFKKKNHFSEAKIHLGFSIIITSFGKELLPFQDNQITIPIPTGTNPYLLSFCLPKKKRTYLQMTTIYYNQRTAKESLLQKADAESSL